MGQRVTEKRSLIFTFVVCLVTALTVWGCGSDDKGTVNDPGDDIVDESPRVNEDIATCLAASIAPENGGACDQLLDLISLATPDGIRHTSLVANQTAPTYDLFTRTWEWHFVRNYSSANGLYSAHVDRTYKWRFLNKSGQAQVTYILGNDTAYTIELTIVAGDGRHALPLATQKLLGLTGRLVATRANMASITVNGHWTRQALDTLRTREAERVLTHSCSLNVVNMQCRRDTSVHPWVSLEGTISGTLTALIDFYSGDAYPEDSVSLAFQVGLESGIAEISMADTVWTCELRRGVIQLPSDSE